MAKKNEDKQAHGRQRDTFCSFCRKSHRQVGPLVEGPGDVYICGECVELCQSIIEQEKRRRGVATPLPTLEFVEQRIHWLVGGESELTKVLASAVHAHYASPAKGETEHDPGKSICGHILLIGPTRSSKILLSSALAHTFDVPFASGNADGVTKDNSALQNEESPLYKLLKASDFDVERAQHGLLYVDGIDRSDVQEAVRKILDGQTNGLLPARLGMDTSQVFLICGGIFAGLDDAIARRGRHPDQPILGGELRAFGLDPALISRFKVVARLAPLNEEAWVQVAEAADLRGIWGEWA